MAYRELSRMHVQEVIRRWQRQESQRAMVRATGLARVTVRRYVAHAERLGLSQTGPPPTDEQLGELTRLGHRGLAHGRSQPTRERLEPYTARLAGWIDAGLQLSRIHELLSAEVPVSYTSLRRFLLRSGLLGRSVRTTVRIEPSAPGEMAEMDFGQLGTLVHAETGARQTVWALAVVLPFSRFAFVWPLVHQTLDEVIAGLEATWRFFDGLPQRLVIDNFPAAVAGPDPLQPRLTRGFLEYSQARGFLVDPARVRHPRDKPHVERFIAYVQRRFWQGGTFSDLADVRTQAAAWCLEVAGQRQHGTTRERPLEVFEQHERSQLLAYDGVPFDVPIWRTVSVHVDHHVSFQSALYSAPWDRCPPRTRLEVRGDRQLVRLYLHDQLVAVHPRKPRGGRSTDPAHYPPERVAYAQRDPQRLIEQARFLGPNVGAFAARLLDQPYPWVKLRQVQKLLRLAERYGAERTDQACAYALGFELLDVRRLEHILEHALDLASGTAAVESLVTVERPAPSSRFARSGRAFDHRFAAPALGAPPC
jgi:Mu transposase-like protein